MEAKQPTEAQIKLFWKRCGIEERFESDTGTYYFHYPNGQCDIELPPIDLNNLFKYAVPKLLHNIEVTLTRYGDRPDSYARIQGYYAENKPIIRANPDPALALFWAIWEVIHESQRV